MRAGPPFPPPALPVPAIPRCARLVRLPPETRLRAFEIGMALRFVSRDPCAFAVKKHRLRQILDKPHTDRSDARRGGRPVQVR